ncbi:hypothetical protein PP747_gp021 [Rhizobium phage RHph_Y38]|uniref:Uncharacterized protein n=1 Tax=Rhizobium phage RHph_Y38 TaxID=2509781 RepID=A0A7S5QX35_9CAUD|nr:hypothetical protein PP747_gp021 [Rhizobium phage RHph_Y38]QIG67722.1 hypothetical protein EVB52_021 [Rhizobium phage RHph_Y38]
MKAPYKEAIEKLVESGELKVKENISPSLDYWTVDDVLKLTQLAVNIEILKDKLNDS